MRINTRRKMSEAQFWRDACIAGGQVTFGVMAAIWFLPPHNAVKVFVLVVNLALTAVFVSIGKNLAKQL